jgi:hypothetical protein
MTAVVMFGAGEVLIIAAIVAVVVFMIVRRK